MKRAALGLAIALVASAAQAAWYKVADSKEGVSFSVSDEDVRIEGDSISVWERQKAKDGTSMIGNVQYDCAKDRWRYVKIYGYSAQGTLTGETQAASQWLPIKPKSVADYMRSLSCALKDKLATPGRAD